MILGELLLCLAYHLLRLGLCFLPLLLEVSINCGPHVVPSELASTTGCVGPEPALLVRLVGPRALVSGQLLLSRMVLFRFVSEAVLLSEPLWLAIHFTQKFLCKMLGDMFLYEVHRGGQLRLLGEV